MKQIIEVTREILKKPITGSKKLLSREEIIKMVKKKFRKTDVHDGWEVESEIYLDVNNNDATFYDFEKYIDEITLGKYVAVMYDNFEPTEEYYVANKSNRYWIFPVRVMPIEKAKEIKDLKKRNNFDWNEYIDVRREIQRKYPPRTIEDLAKWFTTLRNPEDPETFLIGGKMGLEIGEDYNINVISEEEDIKELVFPNVGFTKYENIYKVMNDYFKIVGIDSDFIITKGDKTTSIMISKEYEEIVKKTEKFAERIGEEIGMEELPIPREETVKTLPPREEFTAPASEDMEEVITECDKLSCSYDLELDVFARVPFPKKANLFKLLVDVDELPSNEILPTCKGIVIDPIDDDFDLDDISKEIMDLDLISTELDISEFKLGDVINGKKITQILVEESFFMLKNGGDIIIIGEIGKAAKINGKDIMISSFTPSVDFFDKDELISIMNYEFHQEKIVDFNEVLDRWGITNKGELAMVFQDLLWNDMIKREVIILKNMKEEVLTRAFITHNFEFYMPMIYHQYQINETNEIFRNPKYTLLKLFKEDFLASKFYMISEFIPAISKINKEEEVGLSNKEIGDLAGKLITIGLGGSIHNKIGRPHWFNEEFAEKWKKKLKTIETIVIKENFPELYNFNDEYFEYHSKSKGKLVKVDLKEFFGEYYPKVSHLFAKPTYEFKVFQKLLRWDLVMPRGGRSIPIVDGFPSLGVTHNDYADGSEMSTNDKTSGLYIKKISKRYIALHPLILLLSDYFQWKEVAISVLHHEMIHSLQIRFMQIMMTIAYLEKDITITPHIRSDYGYLDKIITDKSIDKTMFREMLDTNSKRLYIFESLSPEQKAAGLTLEQVVGSVGGHTKSFMKVATSLKDCDIGNEQVRAIWYVIFPAFYYKVFGKNMPPCKLFGC